VRRGQVRLRTRAPIRAAPAARLLAGQSASRHVAEETLVVRAGHGGGASTRRPVDIGREPAAHVAPAFPIATARPGSSAATSPVRDRRRSARRRAPRLNMDTRSGPESLDGRWPPKDRVARGEPRRADRQTVDEPRMPGITTWLARGARPTWWNERQTPGSTRAGRQGL
jgi:hypothetical protein